MPDHPVSLHPSPPFDHDYYDHPRSRAAAEEAKAGVRGHCQECGEKRPLEAHHYAKGPYPPAHLTTADDLTALCRDCHAKAHLGRFLHDVGGVFAPTRSELDGFNGRTHHAGDRTLAGLGCV